METDKALQRALILSDGKPGHRNQAIALARHLGLSFDTVEVHFRRRLSKAISYLLDHLYIYCSCLYSLSSSIDADYCVLIAAGSESYYAAKTIGRAYDIPVVAVMLPKGYRYTDFELIFAQNHDLPPQRDNILTLPINLTYVDPQGHLVGQQGQHYVAFIIGGDSPHGVLDSQQLIMQIENVIADLSEHKFWLTTSRRTSKEVEKCLKNITFDHAIYYSDSQVNPIADFLKFSDYVFITADSTSMISEAVSYGQANVEVLPLRGSNSSKTKADKLISALALNSCLHIYDGQVGKANAKIDIGNIIKKAVLRCGLRVVR
ncbi:MAG: mitochondrial fission ELM1 family protein [Desulfuromonadales bacterium]|nr:mitochondrial fission ELM1 family protein [Desulfuromonadales bacterium]